MQTEVIKEEKIKEEDDKEENIDSEKVKNDVAVRVVPVRPINLPNHLKGAQKGVKDENNGVHSIHLGKRSRSFFSDISNHISTHEMGVDVKEAITAEREADKRALKVATQTWTDLDAEDKDDPMMVTEYVNDIFDYMRVLEVMQAKPSHHLPMLYFVNQN